MPNIILTTDCQRRCSYCFAKGNENKDQKFKMKTYLKVMEFLKKSKTQEVGLLGGEPTLHPQYSNFLDIALDRGFVVTTFTNGMLSGEKIEKINKIIHKRKLAPEKQKLFFLVNVNEEKDWMKNEGDLQATFMRTFGGFVDLSFNIYHKEFDLNFLISLIKEYKLFPKIRIGLAAPLGNKNEFLLTEYYKEVAEKLVAFTDERIKNRIVLHFDCGFPLCMFTEGQLGKLFKSYMRNFRFYCEPIIDVYPDLEISHCYPLSNVHKKNLSEFQDMGEVYSYFKKFSYGLKEKVKRLYPECHDCVHYGQMCAGGCLSTMLKQEGLI
jgi:radical SAM protein with 4Fe4S-binding SPASM domain